MDDRKVVRIQPWIDDPMYEVFLDAMASMDRPILKYFVVTFKIKGCGNKHFTATIQADNEMVALNKFLNKECNDPRMPLFKEKAHE